MDAYLTGVGIALLIGAVKVLVSFSALASTRAKNVKMIGLHYKPLDGGYGSEPTSATGWFFYVVWLLLLAPLLSWLSVASAAWSLVSAIARRKPVALFVDKHLRACGATRAIFEPDAVTLLFQHSRGVPRLIQGLALGALMAAASGSKKAVDADSVQQALLDVEAA